MDEDLARIMAADGVEISRRLVRLFDVVGERAPDNEELRRGIAAVLAEVGLNLLNPAYAAFPALKAEFERGIDGQA